MLSLTEFKKNYRHKKKATKKYIRALESHFGYELFPKRRVFVDNLISRLKTYVSKLPSTRSNKLLVELIETPQFQQSFFFKDLLLTGDLDDYRNGTTLKNHVYSTAEEYSPGITENAGFKRLFPDSFFERLYDFAKVKYNKELKKFEIIEDTLKTSGIPPFRETNEYFFGNTFRTKLVQELFEYKRRFLVELNTKTRVYSSPEIAQLDLDNHKSIDFIQSLRIKQYKTDDTNIIFILMGEFHTNSLCLKTKNHSIGPGKFIVDLINACKDIRFDLFLENAPMFQNLEDFSEILPRNVSSESEDFASCNHRLAEFKNRSGLLDTTYMYFFPVYPPKNAWKNSILESDVMSNVRLHSEDVRWRSGINTYNFDFLLEEINYENVEHIDFLNHRIIFEDDTSKPFDRLIQKEYNKLLTTKPNVARSLQTSMNEFLNQEFIETINPGIKSGELIADTLLTDYYGLLRAFRDFDGQTDSPRVVIFYGGMHHVQNWSLALKNLGATDHTHRDFDKVREKIGNYPQARYSRTMPNISLQSVLSKLKELNIYRENITVDSLEKTTIQNVYSELNRMKQIVPTRYNIGNYIRDCEKLKEIILEDDLLSFVFFSKHNLILEMLEIELHNVFTNKNDRNDERRIKYYEQIIKRSKIEASKN